MLDSPSFSFVPWWLFYSMLSYYDELWWWFEVGLVPIEGHFLLFILLLWGYRLQLTECMKKKLWLTS